MATRLRPRQLKGGCPQGYSWYACTGRNGFLGCCGSDPCGGGGPGSCSDLAAAGLGDLPYGSFADQACPNGGLFYTCSGPPSFFGCCVSNPCSGGCPQNDLRPAGLQGGQNDFTPSLVRSVITSSTVSTTYSSSTSIATSATSASTTSAPSAPSAIIAGDTTSTVAPAPASRNVSAIAGGATGGAIVLLALLAILAFLFRRHARSSRRQQQYAMAASASNIASPEALHPPHVPSAKAGWLPWRRSQTDWLCTFFPQCTYACSHALPSSSFLSSHELARIYGLADNVPSPFHRLASTKLLVLACDVSRLVSTISAAFAAYCSPSAWIQHRPQH